MAVARSIRPSARSGSSPAAAAARPSRNGSPATEAPSISRRVSGSSARSSSASGRRDRGRKGEATLEDLVGSSRLRRRGRSPELLEVERVSGGRLQRPGANRGLELFREQRRGVGRGERLEHEQGAGAARGGDRERVGKRVDRLLRAEPDRDQDGALGRAPAERQHQLERGTVGPLHVVEDEDETAAAGEPAQQVRERPVRSVPLAVAGDRGSRVGERREDRRELRQVLDPPHLEARVVEGSQVRVERIEENRERQVALELARGAAEDEVPVAFGAGAELVEQARLADAGLAADAEQPRSAVAEPLERGVELGLAPVRARRAPAAHRPPSARPRADCSTPGRGGPGSGNPLMARHGRDREDRSR